MKKWFESKTLWVNFAIVLVGLEQQFPVLEAAIDPKWYGIGLFVIGVANMLLRLVTKEAVTK